MNRSSRPRPDRRRTDDPRDLHAGGGRPRRCHLSPHAIERYAERVKITSDLHAAGAELTLLVAHATLRGGNPQWLAHGRCLMHLDVAGTIALPVDPDPRHPGAVIARTVLHVAGRPDPKRRGRRRARRTHRAAERAAARRAHGLEHGVAA